MIRTIVGALTGKAESEVLGIGTVELASGGSRDQSVSRPRCGHLKRDWAPTAKGYTGCVAALTSSRDLGGALRCRLTQKVVPDLVNLRIDSR